MIWRLLASADRRQRQIMKHEQAMNDSKNKADTLPEWRPIMNRDDVLVWLSLAWFVALCGAAIWPAMAEIDDPLGLRLGVRRAPSTFTPAAPARP